MNVLFVCTGNTCRSPMAEAMLKNRAKADIQVKSCGITAMPGGEMSAQTKEVLRQQGIEMNHAATPVKSELVQWADLILTMTASHKETLWFDYPEARKKLYTFKEYALHADKQIWNQLEKVYADLEEKRKNYWKQYHSENDPVKQSESVYEACQQEMKQIHHLKKQLTDSDITDPFGGRAMEYLQTEQEIEACLNQWLSP